MKLSVLEIALVQVIVYAGLWLWNDYIASYMTIVLPAIILAILLISIIVELIEPSRISRKYFVIMGISVVIPLLTGLLFLWISGGRLSWLEGF